MKIVSVIIPCYSSEAYIEKTAGEILAVFHTVRDIRPHLILINDASPDRTFEAIKRIVSAHPGEVTGIDLARNTGQARAKMAGIPYVRGDCAVFMDDDGQHDPRMIPKLLETLDRGYDLVYAEFPELMEALPRRMSSAVLDVLLCLFAGKPRGLKITSYFGVGPASLRILRSYSSRHPFIGGFLMSRHVKVAVVHGTHRPREVGRSRYSLKKLFGRALEMCILFRLPPGKNDPPVYEIREVVTECDTPESAPLHP